MKIKDLIALLAMFPEDSVVYTNQWNYLKVRPENIKIEIRDGVHYVILSDKVTY